MRERLQNPQVPSRIGTAYSWHLEHQAVIGLPVKPSAPTRGSDFASSDEVEESEQEIPDASAVMTQGSLCVRPSRP